MKIKVKFILNAELCIQEGTVVNLHPDYAIPADLVNQDLVFPWQQTMLSLGHKAVASGVRGSRIIDVNKFLHGNESLTERWAALKKAWGLSLKGSAEHLLAAALDKYPEEAFDGASRSIEEAICHFCMRFLGTANRPAFDDAAKFIFATAKKHPAEFSRFLAWYRDEVLAELLESFHELLREYFSGAEEFTQTLLYAMTGEPFDPSAVATSVNFSKTRMFYGNAFEFVTSAFTFFACINNIGAGRKYDEFQTMTLKKYLTIDKANRANPFRDTPALYRFFEGVDSALRNASHHHALKLRKNGQLEYRSGGTGAVQRMSYSQYLFMCNKLAISSAAIVALVLLTMEALG